MRNTMIKGGLLAVVCGALSIGCSSAAQTGQAGAESPEAVGTTSSAILGQYGLFTSSLQDFFCVNFGANGAAATMSANCTGSSLGLHWNPGTGPLDATYGQKGQIAYNNSCLQTAGSGGVVTAQACSTATTQSFYHSQMLWRSAANTSLCLSVTNGSTANGAGLTLVSCSTAYPPPAAQSFTFGAQGYDSTLPLDARLTTALRIIRLVEQQFVKTNQGTGAAALGISFNGSIWSTTSTEEIPQRVVGLLNTYSVYDSGEISYLWSGDDGGSSVNQMFTITAQEFQNTADVVTKTLKMTAAPAVGGSGIGAWVTDADTGKQYRTGRLALSWKYTNATAATTSRNYATDFINRLGTALARAEDNTGANPHPLDVHLQPQSNWANNTSTSTEYITFDPPTDGITPASVTGSSTGSGSIPVSNPANSCVAGSAALVNTPCVLQSFTTDLPNFVTSATTVTNADGSTVNYPAYKIIVDTTTRIVLRCTTGYKCVMN